MLTHYIRNTSSFDSHLYTDDMNATTNARFMLKLRVFFSKGAVGPTAAPGGIKSVPYASEAAWDQLRNAFAAESEKFWTGKYWLIPQVPYTEMQYGPKPGHTSKYQCNAYCELFIDVLDSAADAHKIVNIFNNEAADEDRFPTDSANFSDGDLKERHRFSDGFGGTCTQGTLWHESGHLLGLDHIGVIQSRSFVDSAGVTQVCTQANQNNAPDNGCDRGATRADTCSVMGLGSGISLIEGTVWHDRISQHTGIPKSSWRLSRQRVAPKRI